MHIPVETIIDFHHKRTQCHIDCVNYFAGLLGYHFPEHDNDKNIEPMRTGYAYNNYAKYHPNYNLPANYEDLAKIAITTHHEHASHHVDFYGGDVSKIPNIHLLEMICDWASANFEQVFVLRDYEFETVWEWFNARMKHLNWTDKQLKMIRETTEFLNERTDKEALMQIWQPALEKSDL